MPYNQSCSAGVAHLVERDLAKVEVASSSLVARSQKKTTHLGWFFFLYIRTLRVLHSRRKAPSPLSWGPKAEGREARTGRSPQAMQTIRWMVCKAVCVSRCGSTASEPRRSPDQQCPLLYGVRGKAGLCGMTRVGGGSRRAICSRCGRYFPATSCLPNVPLPFFVCRLHCHRQRGTQKLVARKRNTDCHVAPLLAMTAGGPPFTPLQAKYHFPASGPPAASVTYGSAHTAR